MPLEAVAASASRGLLGGRTTVAASSVGLSRYPSMPLPTAKNYPLFGQWLG
jgi:hypothetical protein